MKNIKLPAKYNGIAEQIIRPTGLLDPVIDIRPSLKENVDKLKQELKKAKLTDMAVMSAEFEVQNQIEDLIDEVRKTIKSGTRCLITTLTKRMAEELTTFLMEVGISVQYIHSDVETIKRIEILRDLRLGKYDVLVGINLLREGLDLPEVSLVAILDADKEGFLRSSSALVQIIGRAARHSSGRVILYADHITGSMLAAIDETYRRRKIQMEYNEKHGITPTTIEKEIKEHVIRVMDKVDKDRDKTMDSLQRQSQSYKVMSPKEKQAFKKEIEVQMRIYADMLEFEKAAKLRDIVEDIG